MHEAVASANERGDSDEARRGYCRAGRSRADGRDEAGERIWRRQRCRSGGQGRKRLSKPLRRPAGRLTMMRARADEHLCRPQRHVCPESPRAARAGDGRRRYIAMHRQGRQLDAGGEDERARSLLDLARRDPLADVVCARQRHAPECKADRRRRPCRSAGMSAIWRTQAHGLPDAEADTRLDTTVERADAALVVDVAEGAAWSNGAHSRRTHLKTVSLAGRLTAVAAPLAMLCISTRTTSIGCAAVSPASAGERRT